MAEDLTAKFDSRWWWVGLYSLLGLGAGAGSVYYIRESNRHKRAIDKLKDKQSYSINELQELTRRWNISSSKGSGTISKKHNKKSDSVIARDIPIMGRLHSNSWLLDEKLNQKFIYEVQECLLTARESRSQE